MPIEASGVLHCVTEDESVPYIELPYTMVYCKPHIFRPTREDSKQNTFYGDTVLLDRKYYIILISNAPRLAKYQAECRVVLSRSGQPLIPLLRTASDVPLPSHVELCKAMRVRSGWNYVGINLTPATADPVVIAIGSITEHPDGHPILTPATKSDAYTLLQKMGAPVSVFPAKRSRQFGRHKGSYKYPYRLTGKEKTRKTKKRKLANTQIKM
jgi:hypothetical protein